MKLYSFSESLIFFYKICDIHGCLKRKQMPMRAIGNIIDHLVSFILLLANRRWLVSIVIRHLQSDIYFLLDEICDIHGRLKPKQVPLRAIGNIIDHLVSFILLLTNRLWLVSIVIIKGKSDINKRQLFIQLVDPKYRRAP